MKGDPLKFRYRVNWRGKVILQVLVESIVGEVSVTNSDGNFIGYGCWRDARTQDITRSDRLMPPAK